MKHIKIHSVPGIDEWKVAARQCIAEDLPPDAICWNNGSNQQNDLFAVDAKTVERAAAGVPVSFSVSKELLQNLSDALCHSDRVRFDVAYRILWRYVKGNKNILKLKTDDDVLNLTSMIKAVRRDAYKITAFLRFREISFQGEEYFVGWYEPEHYSLELKLDFFTSRFKNMRWSILTPYRAAHWDKESLVLEDNPDPNLYPSDDKIEQYWLTYYSSIFNPARMKKKAMMSQMPKKYWKNMPESRLIEDMLKDAPARLQKMVHSEEG